MFITVKFLLEVKFFQWQQEILVIVSITYLLCLALQIKVSIFEPFCQDWIPFPQRIQSIALISQGTKVTFLLFNFWQCHSTYILAAATMLATMSNSFSCQFSLPCYAAWCRTCTLLGIECNCKLSPKKLIVFFHYEWIHTLQLPDL